MDGDSNNTQQQQQAQPQVPEQAPAAAGSDNSLLMGILAYIGILVLIPLFVAKGNAFVQFHVRQGLVLFVIEIIVYVVGEMMWGLYPILSLVNLAMLVLSIIGIINVVQKKEAELPLVGQLAKHIPV